VGADGNQRGRVFRDLRGGEKIQGATGGTAVFVAVTGETRHLAQLDEGDGARRAGAPAASGVDAEAVGAIHGWVD